MWGSALSLWGRGVLRPPLLRNIRVPAPRELKVRVGCACRPGAPRAFCSEARARSAVESAYPAAGLGAPGSDPVLWEEASEREDEGDPAGNALATFNIRVLVGLLRQENAKDICVIQLPLEMKYTDYFVIVSASSTRHLHAMAQYALKVYKHLNDRKNTRTRIEGKETEDWICIDFGNIVVHFMLPETREAYELEKLWTLRSYDDQLAMIKPEKLPEDFIYGLRREKIASEDELIEPSALEGGVQDIGGRKV